MRTAFATAAIVATSSAYTLDVKAVPDWVAGFIYGLTGDNNLDEIEKCFTGGQTLVTDAEAALADIKSGKFLDGVKDVGKIINDLPDSLDNCKGKNLNDDITAIEDWAKVSTDPATLAKKVSKNWLLHGTEVKKDIADEEADWSSGAYFNAGKDAAAAIDRLVPFSKEVQQYGLNLKGDAKFVAGFVYGMVGDNHLSEIEQCYTSTEPLVTDVENFINDLEGLKFVHAIEDFEKFVFNFQVESAPCHKLSDDV